MSCDHGQETPRTGRGSAGHSPRPDTCNAMDLDTINAPDVRPTEIYEAFLPVAIPSIYIRLRREADIRQRR